MKKVSSTHIFLDPVVIEKLRDSDNVVHTLNYSGHFMLVFSSDIEEINAYETRYENYIKPAIDTYLETIEEALKCTYEANILCWKITEVVNILDYNFDGIIVDYKVSVNAWKQTMK